MNEHYLRNLNTYTRTIQKANCTFLLISDKKIVQLGTGVFVKSETEIYLLTAGHVLVQDTHAKLFIPIPNKNDILLVSSLGDFFTTFVGTQAASKDLGCVKISKGMQSKVLEHYVPLPKSIVRMEHLLLDNDERYFIFGYPSTKTKFNFDSRSKMSFTPVRITTHAYFEIEKYNEYHCSIAEHIIVKLQRKVPGINGRRFMPKLNGISGCGMYYLPKLYVPDYDNTIYLIGILTDADFEDQYGISVRMDVFSKLIEYHYNDNLGNTSLNLTVTNYEEE